MDGCEGCKCMIMGSWRMRMRGLKWSARLHEAGGKSARLGDALPAETSEEAMVGHEHIYEGRSIGGHVEEKEDAPCQSLEERYDEGKRTAPVTARSASRIMATKQADRRIYTSPVRSTRFSRSQMMTPSSTLTICRTRCSGIQSSSSVRLPPHRTSDIHFMPSNRST